MDEDVIDAIADGFRQQLEYIYQHTPQHTVRYYEAAALDDIVMMATIINTYEPTYDLRYFYRRAGHPEPYPVHEMK